MSSVTFRSKQRKVSIGGSERSWLAMMANDIAIPFFQLDISSFEIKKQVEHLKRMMDPGHYLYKADEFRFANGFKIAIGGYGGQNMFRWCGKPFSGCTVLSNTAMIVGCDPIRLGIRLHNQCEVHAFVEGPNRKWLAGVIAQGRRSGLYRRERQLYEGWDEVIRLLDEIDDGPVVTYYSVTESFPNPGLVGMDHETPAWDALTEEFQWDVCVAKLREQAQNPSLDIEIKPDGFADYRFGNCLSAFDLLAEDWPERLNLALKINQVPMEYKGT